jgi:hypothetical protein
MVEYLTWIDYKATSYAENFKLGYEISKGDFHVLPWDIILHYGTEMQFRLELGSFSSRDKAKERCKDLHKLFRSMNNHGFITKADTKVETP